MLWHSLSYILIFLLKFTLVYLNTFSSLYSFDAEVCWAPTVRRRVLPQSKLPTIPYNKILCFAARGAKRRAPPPHIKTFLNIVPINGAAGKNFFWRLINPLSDITFSCKINNFFTKKIIKFFLVTIFFRKILKIFDRQKIIECVYQKWVYFCLFESKKRILKFCTKNRFLIIWAFLTKN